MKQGRVCIARGQQGSSLCASFWLLTGGNCETHIKTLRHCRMLAAAMADCRDGGGQRSAFALAVGNGKNACRACSNGLFLENGRRYASARGNGLSLWHGGGHSAWCADSDIPPRGCFPCSRAGGHKSNPCDLVYYFSAFVDYDGAYAGVHFVFDGNADRMGKRAGRRACGG